MALSASVDQVSEAILKELSSTEYACSSLEPLSGGNLNWVFRGRLKSPLPDGTEDVAIKRGEAFSLARPAFKLSTTRCGAEEACLKALRRLPLTEFRAFTVHTPESHYFNAKTNTQVHSFIPNVLDLKQYAFKYFSSPDGPSRKLVCTELGRSLGLWLRGFHRWASLPEQAGLRRKIKENHEMQRIKYEVNYPRLVSAVDNFPTILADAKETFEKIRDMAAEELRNPDLPVIHGDFWTGNTLLPDEALLASTNSTYQHMPVYIVDWELCHLGTPAIDLGQMVSELYRLWLFKSMPEGKCLIEGFVTGYGYMNDDFSFRTALHVGTHLVAWGTWIAGWGSEAQGEEVVRIGKEVVLRAWGKDRAWFEAGDLACLFCTESL